MSSGITWNTLLKQACSSLGPHDGGRIIEQVSGYSRAELVQFGGESVSGVAEARANDMIVRRLGGEPLQYVLGSWAFRNLDLFVDSRVLIPRPETEIVVQLAIDAAQSFAEPLVVDLGTGSGAIALSVALEVKGSTVFATDVSSDALAVARANLAGLGLAGSRVQIYEGSWFDALPQNLRGKINVIVSNPPYIAEHEKLPDEVVNFEPTGALFAGPKGTEALEFILQESTNWLSDDGVVVLELAPHQSSSLQEIAKVHGFDANVIADLTGQDRVIRANRS